MKLSISFLVYEKTKKNKKHTAYTNNKVGFGKRQRQIITEATKSFVNLDVNIRSEMNPKHKRLLTFLRLRKKATRSK